MKAIRTDIALQFDISDEGPTTSIDVWPTGERDETYLGAWFGAAVSVARRLAIENFHGLARYLERVDGAMVGYLAGMEVRRGLTGKGIGSAMLKRALDLLREQGVDVVFLHRSGGVRSTDADLKRFYQRFGFKDLRCCKEDVWPVMVLYF